MSTVWVECWKCDECKHRWIKGEIWPDRCASSKCRKRSWNKFAAQSVGAVDPLSERVETPAVEVAPVPVVNLSALPVADRLAVARAALAKVSEPRGEILPPVGAAPMREPCSYTEWDEQTGETYRCGLAAHSWKVKHTRGAKV